MSAVSRGPSSEADATPDRSPETGRSDPRRWMLVVVRLGAISVVAYVASWAIAGAWWSGYDPTSQAISELFAIGAPRGPARLLIGSLILSGLLLPPFAYVLHRLLPGRGVAGPAVAAFSGLMTVAIVAFPCSAGCPGAGTTFTDTMHTAIAGTGYLTLVAAPLFFARRLRGHDDRLALASAVLGGLALIGFLLHVSGVGGGSTGLLQRLFNTTADAWYVLAAVTALRHARGERTAGSSARPATQEV